MNYLKVYRHYRGVLYQFMFISVGESDGKEYAVYRHILTGSIYHRRLEEFLGEAWDEDSGKRVRRFVPLVED